MYSLLPFLLFFAIIGCRFVLITQKNDLIKIKKIPSFILFKSASTIHKTKKTIKFVFHLKRVGGQLGA